MKNGREVCLKIYCSSLPLQNNIHICYYWYWKGQTWTKTPLDQNIVKLLLAFYILLFIIYWFGDDTIDQCRKDSWERGVNKKDIIAISVFADTNNDFK